ncbi:MAG: hypothetical protein O3A10_16110 [Chloroflexi bacterium]|nr:hypothetical protein [Chloroflexota bacterium]MDA1145335.1 hypothetical protein [Chloroflexota bacterium]
MAKRTDPAKRQRAELRVVRKSSSGLAQLLFARVRGKDIYVGGNAQAGLQFRATYHESGQTHLYTPFGQTGMSFEEPPDAIKGVKLLWQTSTGADRWDYQLKADSEKKQTLIIDDGDFPDGACVMALAAEPEEQLVKGLLAGTPFEPSKIEVSGHLVANWVSPVIVVLVLKWNAATAVAIHEQIAAAAGESSELNGFIYGPDPNGLEWEYMGKTEADGTVVRPGAPKTGG